MLCFIDYSYLISQLFNALSRRIFSVKLSIMYQGCLDIDPKNHEQQLIFTEFQLLKKHLIQLSVKISLICLNKPVIAFLLPPSIFCAECVI